MKFLIYFFTLLLLFAQPLQADEKPELFLLKVYHPDKVDLSSGQWVWSEKFDGVRAFWTGERLISRGGHEIHTPSWFLAQLPPFAIDGELWLGRGQFQQTVSIVRRQRPDERWHQIQYQIFEVPHQSGNLFQRLEVLERYLNSHPAQNIHIIPQHVTASKAEVEQALQKVMENRGEGLVLRDATLPYQTGRLSSALKIKPFLDAECQVKGYQPGKGKYQGQVGALICEMENGVSLRLGSGLSDQQRQHPPKRGQWVTFKYQGLTQSGKPRHPVFLRIRKDSGF